MSTKVYKITIPEDHADDSHQITASSDAEAIEIMRECIREVASAIAEAIATAMQDDDVHATAVTCEANGHLYSETGEHLASLTEECSSPRPECPCGGGWDWVSHPFPGCDHFSVSSNARRIVHERSRSTGWTRTVETPAFFPKGRLPIERYYRPGDVLGDAIAYLGALPHPEGWVIGDADDEHRMHLISTGALGQLQRILEPDMESVPDIDLEEEEALVKEALEEEEELLRWRDSTPFRPFGGWRPGWRTPVGHDILGYEVDDYWDRDEQGSLWLGPDEFGVVPYWD